MMGKVTDSEYTPLQRPDKVQKGTMPNLEADQLVQDDGPKVTLGSASITAPKKPAFLDIWTQVLASTISLLAVIQAGINLAFSGVLIPQLFDDPNYKAIFTKDEASWIASLAVISQPFGAMVAGPLMDTFGRKAVCIVQCIPMIVGWIITYFTVDSLWPLYLARMLAGFGSGLTLVGLVYTAEISHVSYRAMLLSMNSVYVALGILITTVVGVYIDWHNCALVFGILCTISCLLAFLIPESPYWLALYTYSRQEKARVIIRMLNRNVEAYQAEWERIQEAVMKKRQQAESGDNKNWCHKFLETFQGFKDRRAYIPFLILLCLFLLQQTSGTYVVIFYTINIFQSVSGNLGSGFDAYSATVALGILRFVLSLVAVGIARVLGRRTIMIVSSMGMAVSAGLAAGFTCVNHIYTVNFSANNATGNTTDVIIGTEVVSNWWIMVSILLYVSAGSIGLMVIPWTLIGELLPIRVRAFGSGIMVAYGYLLLFVIIKTFPFLVDLITFPVVLVSYAIMSAACAIFVYFCLPETLGKSFKEIEKYFERHITADNS